MTFISVDWQTEILITNPISGTHDTHHCSYIPPGHSERTRLHATLQRPNTPNTWKNAILILTNIPDRIVEVDSLKDGKAPGKDAIPPEAIKHRKPALLHHLHVLLLHCWKEGTVPQDMRYAKIVTLCKNKGDRSDCNNYRGISLLSVVGKVFARVALAKLQILAKRTLPESQCGFRTGRSNSYKINFENKEGPWLFLSLTAQKHLTSLAGEDYSIYWRKLAVPRNY